MMLTSGNDSFYLYENFLGGSSPSALTDVSNQTIDGGAGYDTAFLDDTYPNPNFTLTVSSTGVATITAASGHTTFQNFELLKYKNGAQVAIGSAGNDSVAGGSSSDPGLYGLDGNDTLDGGAGNDTMVGGAGNDTYVIDSSGDSVRETTAVGGATDAGGNDTVQSAISYILGNFVENLTLTGAAAVNATGNALANALGGNGAGNTLTGGDGNDSLDGGAGADTMLGGAGNDHYTVDNAGDSVQESTTPGGAIDAGGADWVFNTVSYTLGNFVENISLQGGAAINGTGNALANTIMGNAADNALRGLDGNDALYGGDGNDALDGGAGADTMLGGAGNDNYTVDNAGDSVQESTAPGGATDAGGTDWVFNTVSYTLGNFVENLWLQGGAAINGTGNALANTIQGNNAANVLGGLAGNDIIQGGGGSDVLDGGAGLDTMLGGAGNDTYSVDNAGDSVQESTTLGGAADAGGVDLVNSSVSYTLGGFIEKMTLTGAAAVNGTGNGLANTLVGNSAGNVLGGQAGNDVIDGGGGADTMLGGAGNDTYVVNAAGDSVQETTLAGGTVNAGGLDLVKSSIDYTLGNFVEKLTLTGAGAISGTGNGLANAITGNVAANHIDGAGRADTISGGDGNDVLTGGLGNDAFVFNTALAATNVDTITDFKAGGALDVIYLDKDIFTALGAVTGPTALDPSTFVAAAAAQDANDHFIYDRSTGALYYDADGNGAGAQLQFATIGTTVHPTLAAGDFLAVV